MSTNNKRPVRQNVEQGVKLKGEAKMARIPIKIEQPQERLKKPDWIRIKLPNPAKIVALKEKIQSKKLVTVCEEASCPNLAECYNHGTATFMVMGEICTRRCPFCDVGHGRPNPLDPDEPNNLAETVRDMQLKYVVITSVDRDDLKDGGAAHFTECVRAVKALNPGIKVEILVPDFRGRRDIALDALATYPPEVFNHNLETAPRLYKQARPGSDYQWSLDLIRLFKARFPHIPTKSGLMVGLGETNEEIIEVMQDLRAHDCDMITIGQYLQPSKHHLPVQRYVTPAEFDEFAKIARELGFSHVASGPLVRSSYHADKQAAGEEVS